MDLGSGLGHLSYSTLVHAGDTWEEMNASLRTFVPQVKANVCPDAPFGVSLRLSAASVATLTTIPLSATRCGTTCVRTTCTSIPSMRFRTGLSRAAM